MGRRKEKGRILLGWGHEARKSREDWEKGKRKGRKNELRQRVLRSDRNLGGNFYREAEGGGEKKARDGVAEKVLVSGGGELAKKKKRPKRQELWRERGCAQETTGRGEMRARWRNKSDWVRGLQKGSRKGRTELGRCLDDIY